MTESEPRNLFSKPPIQAGFRTLRLSKISQNFIFAKNRKFVWRIANLTLRCRKKFEIYIIFYSRVVYHLMTKNIKGHYSIGFKLNAGLMYSIASRYIHSLIIFDMSSFIQIDLCRISCGQTGVSTISWHYKSLLMYILHQEGSFFYCPFFTDLFTISSWYY